MKEITFCGKQILIDDEDLDFVLELQPKAHLYKDKYFLVNGFEGRKRKTKSLQRRIIRYDGPLDVAHKDGNHFNFQKSNLEPQSHFKNTQLNSSTTNGMVGVSFDKRMNLPIKNRWRAYVRHSGKRVYIDSFETAEEAVITRKQYIENNNLM